MSALTARVLPARDPGSTPGPQRRLRPAPERRERQAKPRLAYAMIALGGIAVIVVAQLLLSIALAQGAYEIDTYQGDIAELSRVEQTLAEDLDRLESPQFLSQNAEALGMVLNTNPVYLRLSDGAVLGEPTVAAGGAAASAPLVTNSLIAGVPLVTEQQPATTPDAAVPTDAAGPTLPAPPPMTDGLPTPATH